MLAAQSFHPVYTITQLTTEVKTLLENKYESIWVEGEISNLRLPGSGHFYFSLKDEAAQMRAVMFRLQNRFLRFEPKDGLQIICYGRLSVYEPRGEYQMVIEYMEPKGLGMLQLAFEQLKEKLFHEGLFDPVHKKPLPYLPQKIGIVTSPAGAAIRDILQIIDRRFANVHILIYPVRVQGSGAAMEIAQAITELSQVPGIEVMIVGRGGGSLEDLWAFNEEVVARAIFGCPVPVISAVGHEVDFTIADLVADLRAPTPSAAAELVVQNKIDLLQSLDVLGHRLHNAGRTAWQVRRERISFLRHRLLDPRRRLSDQRLQLDDLMLRLGASVRHHLAHKTADIDLQVKNLFLFHPGRLLEEYSFRRQELVRRLALGIKGTLRLGGHRIEGCIGRLNTLSPLSILARGYSITRLLASGEIVCRAEALRETDRVKVQLYQGEFIARVEEIREALKPED